jgi:hypothetical protein
MTTLEHLSYSSISAYLMCAAGWNFKYIQKLPASTSADLVFGSAFHNTVEDHLAGKGDLLQLWPGKFSEQVEKNPVIDWKDGTQESYHNEGIRLLGHADIIAGIKSISPAVNADGCLGIEQKVELHVPSVPLPIIGFIDVITADGVPGDFKTSSRSWSDDKAEGEMQPLFYLAALNQAGIPVPNWTFRHYVFVKTKTPQFQCIEHNHNPNQLMWLFKMIGNVWKAIEAGVFPENPISWKCNPTWCEYFSACRGKYA